MQTFGPWYLWMRRYREIKRVESYKMGSMCGYGNTTEPRAGLITY